MEDYGGAVKIVILRCYYRFLRRDWQLLLKKGPPWILKNVNLLFLAFLRKRESGGRTYN